MTAASRCPGCSFAAVCTGDPVLRAVAAHASEVVRLLALADAAEARASESLLPATTAHDSLRTAADLIEQASAEAGELIELASAAIKRLRRRTAEPTRVRSTAVAR